MNPKNINQITKQGESESVEFKPSLSQASEIIETLSALANKKGGKILVGISNSSNVLGIDIGKDTIEQLTSKIKDNIEPKLYPEISVLEHEGKKVISINIQESKEKPVLAFGRAYKRVGKSTLKISRDELKREMLDSNKVYWDEQICEDAALKDIDNGKVKKFLKEATRQRGLNISENVTANEALMQLKLFKDEKLTNAAVLLFSKEPKFLQSEIKCIRFSGNEPVKPYIDFQTLEGSVLDLVEKAEDFILRNIRKAIWLVPGQVQREEKYEYPLDAIREAIVNAVVHRDYSSPSKIQIRIFEDCLEIWNPGRLPEGWTVEKLKQKHESIPKNPLLFKQFFWIKLVEDVGGGTIDMINECEKYGLPSPEFEDTETSLIVRFRKAVLTKELMEKIGLNERQKEVVKHLEKYSKITRLEYEKIYSVSERTANRELSELANKKIIEKKGKGPEVYYILARFGEIWRDEKLESSRLKNKGEKND